MKVISTEQIRSLDKTAIEQCGIPGELLMERAGKGLARIIRSVLPGNERKILLIAGNGNNGGDAFVAARCLAESGYECSLWLTCLQSAIKGDALKHLQKMRGESEIAPVVIPDENAWKTAVVPSGTSLIVDGILGTGIKGAARGAAAAAIQFINRHANVCKVVAIDVPSGLDSDTGRAAGDCVMADKTVTMALPKLGLIQPEGVNYTGSLDVVDIGIPGELTGKMDSGFELVTERDIASLFPRRARDSHKGDFGRVLVIAGAAGFSGAAGMSVRAALRSGAGLVSAAVPACIAATVSGWAQEAMIHPCPETGAGTLSLKLLDKFDVTFKDYDAVLLGPGMGRDEETAELIRTIVENIGVAVVLDADGLNAFENRSAPLVAGNAPVMIITPHPGELARILKCSVRDIQADRFGSAGKAAELTHAIVVLKGAGTVIAEQSQKLHINMTGNPGMSSGGMGDVLAGLTVGLAAQGMSGFDAARAAAFLHGRAAEIAARTTGENAMLAGDVIEAIPSAFRDFLPR